MKVVQRTKSLADVRSVDHLNEDCWSEVLQKRNRWIDRDRAEDVVIKEVSSLTNVAEAGNDAKRYRSGLASIQPHD